WNRGVERRRADEPPDDGAHVDLVAWLRGDPPADVLARLYVPRNEPRWLLRNALVALGNTGGPDGETRRVLRRHAAGEDALLAEHATWALGRVEERCH